MIAFILYMYPIPLRGRLWKTTRVQLKPFQYSIIHNFIDTELFRYTKKDKEQRRHILTIKPFSGRKYCQ